MKIQNAVWVGLALLAGTGVFAEDILVSWTSNGVLQATGMEPGSTCTVERTSSLSVPFVDVSSEVVGSSGITSTEVFMEQEVSFFRVCVVPPGETIPEGMVAIPAGVNSGTNPLGAEESYWSGYPETYALTNATIFYMDQYEVTKAQWDTVYNWAVLNGYSFDNSGLGKASDHPVHTVNWYDCVKWCNARSEMESKTPCYNLSTWSCDFNANGYRLPTSDEWEYAARGGLQSKRFPWGDTITHSQVNYRSSSEDSYDTSPTRGYHPAYDDSYPYTSPVGSFPSNGYGLYDMSGNVGEWCNTSSGSTRCVRDGGFNTHADATRCGYNDLWGPPFVESFSQGFRAICR